MFPECVCNVGISRGGGGGEQIQIRLFGWVGSEY